MADNVEFQSGTLATPGASTIVATDDCGGAQVQIFKQAVATNGSATLIPADATDGLLVNLGANNDVTVTGTVTATGPLTDTQLRAAAVPVSMAAVPTGGATAANQATEIASLASIDGKITAVNTGAVTISAALPAGTNAIGKLAANSGVDIGDVDVTSVSGTVTTKETRSSTGTTTSVASSASNVTLLASNANRLGATIYNDSTQVLYVKFGATASASSFAVAMAAASYYEVPFNYTGIIDGIWASANGNARITELT